MGFRQADNQGRGGFARIWAVEDKGKYSEVKMSTSKKRKDGMGYETDFSSQFVRFIGDAHDKANELDINEKGVTVQITSCEVLTPYDAEKKKGYINYLVYDFEIPDSESSAPAKSSTKSAAKTSKAKTKAKEVEPEEEQDDDLPF